MLSIAINGFTVTLCFLYAWYFECKDTYGCHYYRNNKALIVQNHSFYLNETKKTEHRNSRCLNNNTSNYTDTQIEIIVDQVEIFLWSSIFCQSVTLILHILSLSLLIWFIKVKHLLNSRSGLKVSDLFFYIKCIIGLMHMIMIMTTLFSAYIYFSDTGLKILHHNCWSYLSISILGSIILKICFYLHQLFMKTCPNIYKKVIILCISSCIHKTLCCFCTTVIILCTALFIYKYYIATLTKLPKSFP